MRYLLTALSLLALCSTPALARQERILIVVTSHSKLGDTGRDTGFYLTEVTHPYQVFKEAGFQVDFVSPQGGAAPVDGLEKADDESKTLLEDPEFKAAISQTKKPEEVKVEDYAAIFFAGGHGTMWDLPDHQKLQDMTARIYEGGGSVAAVCHGPVALVNVKLSSGRYLVQGQPVAAFTNEEEEAVGLTEVMPFLLETKLKERGAEIEKAPKFEEKVAVGERLVTGQNPASARGVAQELVKILRP